MIFTEKVYKAARKYIEDGIGFAVAEIISSDGSTPRGEGSEMLITMNETHATIGGGAIEGEVIQLARSQSIPEKKNLSLQFDMDGSDPELICGGRCKVIITYFDPSLPASVEDIKILASAEEYALTPMYIFGGGHVARETAALAEKTGFRVTVIDDRAEYANPSRFPDCKTMVAPEYDDLPEPDEGAFLIIMTRGHSFDKKVLAWALEKKYFYLGMVGSRSKREALYNSVAAKGIPLEKIYTNVHCPIGLPIGGQTPAEIAISIMAEILQVKYGKSEKVS